MCEIETVSMAAYEAQAARFARAIRYMAVGWFLSVAAMGLVLVISLSYTEEVVTETTTETVEQSADNYGNNHYIGGDLNGEANYYTNTNENDQDDEAGTGGAN